ncbi:MAG TPA: signal peptide peptidase SppA [Kofleriaceae bacterium]|nr:signal peptide peptidase SppA [Kofleriaceae bacterium]
MRIAVSVAVLTIASAAHAQVATRYAESPTDGLELPATPLAGEHDARAVVVNPGGIALLRGPEAALALDEEDSSVATSAGPGFGGYAAESVGLGKLLPRLGVGLGVEWLRPPRSELAPDPGQPFRFTLAYAAALRDDIGIGVAWHHFIADGALSGVNAFDAGISTRWTNYLAVGAVVRDLATADIANTPVQRRYELEADVRPFQTDALDVAVGGRVGETRGDLDGWARASLRVTRGVYLLGEVESRELHAVIDSPMGELDQDQRELRATLGLDVSFGKLGVAALGTGVRDDHGGNHALGSTQVITYSAIAPPSVVPPADHLERIQLQGELSARELTAMVMRLRDIARDDSVKGVIVQLDSAEAGWAALEEVRDELAAVRRAGKKVFAYMVAGTSRDYFVASVADKIYVDPAGGIRLTGMTGTALYFRGTFDLIGVLPQFQKIGEYKSAPEQLTDRGPSAPAARMTHELFDSMWGAWLAAVAAGRKLDPARVQALVDGGPYTAGDLAHLPELVDAVAPPDKIAQLIDEAVAADLPIDSAPVERPDRWHRPGIAVIYVEGDIVDGKSHTLPVIGASVTGGQTIIAAIASARADPRVGAIVLRIDSPGGSALASELIAREVFATRGTKPIVCSMSNLAASGGYFVAAGCDLIFAEPMTITGSIGIFTGKFDVSHLLSTLGVTTETLKAAKRADLESMFRPYTDEEQALVLDKLRYMYGRFIGAVAAGRGMAKDDVDKVGRGHVYTGAQARPIKLVDRFGGLADAIEEAKRRIGVAPDERIQLYELPKVPSNFIELITSLLGDDDDRARTPGVLELPVVRELLGGLPASMLAAPGPQARLPFTLEWP